MKSATLERVPSRTSSGPVVKTVGNTFDNKINFNEPQERMFEKNNKKLAELNQSLEKKESKYNEISEYQTEKRIDSLKEIETILKQIIKIEFTKNKKSSPEQLIILKKKIIERVNLEIQLETENAIAKIQKSGKEYIKLLENKKGVTTQIVEDNLAGIKLQVETAIKNIQKTSNAYKILANWNCDNINKVEDLERLNMSSFAEFLKKQKS